MDEARDYLRALEKSLAGSRRSRDRLLAELRAHLDDAIAERVADGVEPAEAEGLALAGLGPVEDVAGAWRARCARCRRHTHRNVAVTVVATAAAAVLAVAQHADGHQNPAPAAPARQACTSGAAAYSSSVTCAPHVATFPPSSAG